MGPCLLFVIVGHRTVASSQESGPISTYMGVANLLRCNYNTTAPSPYSNHLELKLGINTFVKFPIYSARMQKCFSVFSIEWTRLES